jgi:hypothetical protein
MMRFFEGRRVRRDRTQEKDRGEIMRKGKMTPRKTVQNKSATNIEDAGNRKVLKKVINRSELKKSTFKARGVLEWPDIRLISIGK